MKKIYTILFLFIFAILLLVACQKKDVSDTNTDISAPKDQISQENSKDSIVDSPADLWISIHSLEELERMHEILSSTNDKEIEEYLQSSESGGAQSLAELKYFVELVDNMPYAPFLSGEISWIALSSGVTIDNGKPFSVLTVTTQAENGEWFRIEYDLLTFGKNEFIADRISQISTTSEMLLKPVQSADKKIQVYAEETKTYNTGETSVIWSADINGVFARIFYSSVGAGVNAESIFTDVSVSNIRSLCNNTAD